MDRLGLGGDGRADGTLGLADAGAGRAFDGRPAPLAFPDSRLEELTPELPDPADRVRDGPERHHGSRPRL